jgi:GTP-binding protein YchF
MQIALVGLPWSGKTTLFNALAAYSGIEARAQAGTVAHCVVPVPDSRLGRLTEIFQPRKTTHATVEYLDVPGLDVRGTSGQGVPGVIVAQIKNATALVEVIGGFADDQPSDPAARVAAWRGEAEALELEMLVGDLAIVENRRERLRKQMMKAGRQQFEQEYELLGRCEEALSDNLPLRRLDLSPAELVMLSGFQLLTQKPVLRLVNTDETALPEVPDWIASHWGETEAPLEFSAAIEGEIALLPAAEQAEFRSELGIGEPLLPRLLRASQELLGLITFFTIGDKEVRAWPIRRGTSARAAAGEVHTDMERGFIRAEVVPFTDLDDAGSLATCRERGTLRLEGKEYEVRDGDVVTVRFSV